MKPTSIGGQAVISGVMMRSPERIALAVRREDGSIVSEITKEGPPLSKKHKILGIPVIRGVVSFIESLVTGMQTMSRAAEIALDDVKEETKERETEAGEEKDSKESKEEKKESGLEVALVVAVALIIGIGIFVVAPTLLTGLLGKDASSLVKNLIDGAFRLLIFVVYVYGIGFIKDIKDVYRYHGAEHKTISCYEHEKELTVDNARGFTTAHPRCGTTYLLLVVVLSILVFSFFGWSESVFQRIGIRLAALPIVAGLAYELLKVCGKYENPVTKIIRAPGMLLQRLTTKEPDDGMLEVAIEAFRLALTGEQRPQPDTVGTVTVDEPA